MIRGRGKIEEERERERGRDRERVSERKRAFMITEYPQLAESKPTCCMSNRATCTLYIIPRDPANILRG